MALFSSLKNWLMGADLKKPTLPSSGGGLGGGGGGGWKATPTPSPYMASAIGSIMPGLTANQGGSPLPTGSSFSATPILPAKNYTPAPSTIMYETAKNPYPTIAQTGYPGLPPINQASSPIPAPGTITMQNGMPTISYTPQSSSQPQTPQASTQPFYPTPTGAPIPTSSFTSSTSTTPPVPQPITPQNPNAGQAGYMADQAITPKPPVNPVLSANETGAPVSGGLGGGSAVSSDIVSVGNNAQTPGASSQSDMLLEELLRQMRERNVEEETAQKEANALDASYQLGSANIQDKPIAMPFITGQQAALARRYSALSMPLQQRLALAQAKRVSAMEIGKFALEQAKDKEKSAKEEARYTQEQNKPLSIDGQLVQRQPDGSFKSVFGSPKQQSISEQYGTGTIGEYNFAKSQGYKGSFSDYQNEDANRKASVARAGSSGLSPYQENQAFLNISNKYQANTIVNQAVNGKTAIAIADQIIADPSKATSQLASLYLLVKNLDPTSAVREGELALANSTQSYLQQWGNTLARINEGRVISPSAAKELAMATKELAKAWNETASRVQRQYQSQADVSGVGTQFKNYLGGYDSSFNNAASVLQDKPSQIKKGNVIYQLGSDGTYYPVGSA